jgi:biopolymer transport protein TolQ
MNPADISSSVAPLTSSNLSLFHLFWHAHWIVESVMVGLLVCSVWVWKIAIDKTLLFARLRRAGDHFEEAFWSGQSLEDLYKSLATQPEHSTGALFVAAMREWKRSLEGHVRSLPDCRCALRKSWTSPSLARSSGWNGSFWCWQPSVRPDPLSVCSARWPAS